MYIYIHVPRQRKIFHNTYFTYDTCTHIPPRMGKTLTLEARWGRMGAENCLRACFRSRLSNKKSQGI